MGGSERVLKKPFPVKNNPEGIALFDARPLFTRADHEKAGKGVTAAAQDARTPCMRKRRLENSSKKLMDLYTDTFSFPFSKCFGDRKWKGRRGLDSKIHRVISFSLAVDWRVRFLVCLTTRLCYFQVRVLRLESMRGTFIHAGIRFLLWSLLRVKKCIGKQGLSSNLKSGLLI